MQKIKSNIELSHIKTSLKIFVVVVVIQKEGLAGTISASFCYDTEYRISLYCLQRLYFILDVIPKEPGLAYNNNNNLKTCFA